LRKIIVLNEYILYIIDYQQNICPNLIKSDYSNKNCACSQKHFLKFKLVGDSNSKNGSNQSLLPLILLHLQILVYRSLPEKDIHKNWFSKSPMNQKNDPILP
jgi:hypothetical protein